MERLCDSSSLTYHLESLSRDLMTQFNWVPSTRFLQRVRLFAYSLGPSNYSDLMALILCEASDPVYSHREDEREMEILRAVDRQRKKWCREAQRLVSLQHDPPAHSGKPIDAESKRIDAADLAKQIRSFVQTQLGEDDQKIYQARFEQELEYRDVRTVLEDRFTEENLRQRAARIRKQISSHLKRNNVDVL